MTLADQREGRDEIRRKVAGIVIEALQAGRAANSLDDGTYLGNLGLDSLNVVDILMGLEREFNLSFDEEEIDFDAFETLGSLTDFVIGMQRR